MRGHITKRGKKSWAVILDLGRDSQGRRVQKWHSVKGTMKDAERRCAELVNQLELGTYVEPNKRSVGEHLRLWMDEVKVHNLEPRTFDRFDEIVRKHLTPALGHVALKKLSPQQIQSYYSHALKAGRLDGKGGLAPATVVQFHRILHSALKNAERLNLIAVNPASRVDPPKVKKYKPRVLPEAEVSALLEALRGDCLFMPSLLAITTGMRRGEVLGLRWKDIDFDRGSLLIVQTLDGQKGGLVFKPPKTDKSNRLVLLPDFVVEELKRHRQRQTEERLQLGAEW